MALKELGIINRERKILIRKSLCFPLLYFQSGSEDKEWEFTLHNILTLPTFDLVAEMLKVERRGLLSAAPEASVTMAKYIRRLKELFQG